ncbi:MAG: methyltransferase domain-containing protein [Deltaproteobacteria bacterium]|nr:methyltransferase domain-containing protein [Deltaproteobacteria bacterium]
MRADNVKNKLFLKMVSLDKIIQDFLIERYYFPAKGKRPPSFPYGFFEKGVAELSLSFTSDRGSLTKNYFNQKELRSGYIAYFLLVNALKIPPLLRQAPADSWPDTKEPIKILDLGSGPGTGLLGSLLFFTKASIHYTAVDQNSAILEEARLLHQKLSPHFPLPSKFRSVKTDLEREPLPAFLHHDRYDLILMVNTLNEIFHPEKRRNMLIRLLNHHLTPQGKILIVEPALRKTTLELMELHDALLSSENPQNIPITIAPCTHQRLCPMLKENRRDWCHTYIEWEPTEMIEEFDQRIGIRKDYLKCSYLILAGSDRDGWRGSGARPSGTGEHGWAEPETGPVPSWRVVSSLMRSNGKSEVVLCGEESAKSGQLLHTERLDRDRSPMNTPFDRLKRGYIVEMEAIKRVEKETPLKIIS